MGRYEHISPIIRGGQYSIFRYVDGDKAFLCYRKGGGQWQGQSVAMEFGRVFRLYIDHCADALGILREVAESGDY